MKIVSLFSIFLMISHCNAYSILIVFPYPVKSHAILGDGYVRHLLKAGHDVTYITPYAVKDPKPNLRVINVLDDNYELEIHKIFTLNNVLNEQMTFSDMMAVGEDFVRVSNSTVMDNRIQAFINNPNEKFDVVIAEWMFTDIYSGFASLFECPLIISSSMDTHSMILRLIDEMPNPVFSWNMMNAEQPPLSFIGRIKNLIFEIFVEFLLPLAGPQDAIFESAFGPAFKLRGREIPILSEIKYNVSMVLGNSHVSTGSVLKTPPAYAAIGGYHIPDEIAGLPQNFKKIMDDAKDGVIYFSLGSFAESKTFPDKMKKELLEIFGKLKKTVIWKFEETFDNTPRNLHIVKWAPQQSILAHPNCILFISHGGLLSTTEALHFGVPIIGVPVFGDQPANVKKAAKKGFGIEVTLTHNFARDLNAAIEEALSNPSYRIKAKEMSLVYHDRPVPPGKELVHWVEHVVKTKGAHHLRSPALTTPIYQKLYLDLLLLVIIVNVAFICLVRKCFSKKTKVSKSKKDR